MTSQIYIQGTATDPTQQAQHMLRDRGDELLAELAAKVALATELQLRLVDREEARETLIDFCTHRVVRHLLATDRVLYSVAAGAAETRLLVRALRAQHDLVAARIADLKRADSSAEVAASAHALVGLLEVCHHVEQEVLLPALAVLPGVDLSALVDDVETLLAGGALDIPEVLDVREIPHGRRHPRIFGIYARLAPGESFVLVNNHDPKPLRREFQATYPDQFGWDYLEAGPDRWQVRIGRLPVEA
ncbi:DUF2249 domain-containing protein [Pseudonocardia sp. H11422]|uniref:DUF2249 domain-containing protein n=1 Tax=Pseudonocardia sp. H11422 TaxID=2835866 RepID=UPI0027E28A47|nr:DUF2249 domain-containing protein [Pseudonocardia sp. H11422]